MNKKNNFPLLYACLTIIILTFFVFLTVNSTISPKKKKIAIGSLIGSFGLFKSGINPFGEEYMKKIGWTLINIGSSRKILNALQNLLIKSKLENFIEISAIGNFLVFKVKKNIAFLQGSDKIKKVFYVFLNRSFNILSGANFQQIEIYAYPDRIYNKNFISPFDLSSHRAYNVARFYENRGISKNLIKAFGEGFFSNFGVIIKIKGKIKEVASLNIKPKNINIEGFKFEVK